MVFDGRLQLLDVLCPPLPESGLSLAIPLLPLFRSCVYLDHER